jgi:hypothetical protein
MRIIVVDGVVMVRKIRAAGAGTRNTFELTGTHPREEQVEPDSNERRGEQQAERMSVIAPSRRGGTPPLARAGPVA